MPGRSWGMMVGGGILSCKHLLATTDVSSELTGGQPLLQKVRTIPSASAKL